MKVGVSDLRILRPGDRQEVIHTKYLQVFFVLDSGRPECIRNRDVAAELFHLGAVAARSAER